jgi:hypothetical protein
MVISVAKAEYALLRPALLLIAPRTPEGGVEAICVERLPKPLSLPHVGVERPMVERVDALL